MISINLQKEIYISYSIGSLLSAFHHLSLFWKTRTHCEATTKTLINTIRISFCFFPSFFKASNNHNFLLAIPCKKISVEYFCFCMLFEKSWSNLIWVNTFLRSVVRFFQRFRQVIPWFLESFRFKLLHWSENRFLPISCIQILFRKDLNGWAAHSRPWTNRSWWSFRDTFTQFRSMLFEPVKNSSWFQTPSKSLPIWFPVPCTSFVSAIMAAASNLDIDICRHRFPPPFPVKLNEK